MQFPQPSVPEPSATIDVVSAESNPTVATRIADIESTIETNSLAEEKDWPRRVTWYEAPGLPVSPTVLEESSTDIGSVMKGTELQH